jgi:hypothetical protein
MSDLSTQPFPNQWISELKSMMEGLIHNLQTSIDEFSTQLVSVKKLVKSQKIFNLNTAVDLILLFFFAAFCATKY